MDSMAIEEISDLRRLLRRKIDENQKLRGLIMEVDLELSNVIIHNLYSSSREGLSVVRKKISHGLEQVGLSK